MPVLFYLAIAIAAFLVAGRFYGAYVARQLGETPDRPTPAQTYNDGCDYVPTKRSVLFAHHFSAIAGAGPIIGPTVAILYGFVPAWLWVVIGGIFVGAVHDFAALFVSMREGGKSVAVISRKTMGKPGFILFILFTIVMIVLVTSSFMSAVSVSLTSLWPLQNLELGEDQRLLTTTVKDGVVMGRIGGIASTSVLIITLFSPMLGWLIYKRGIHTLAAYALAFIICSGSIVAGIAWPIVLPANVWMVIISVYVLIAAGIPVWAVLQPRDFINVQILYAGIALMFTSLVVAGGHGVAFSMPNVNLDEGVKNLGLIWPMMFITIACGAISGFHSLVAGGTTGKQLACERDARRIGFNAMLLESLLAVCVLLALGVGLTFADYKEIVWPSVAGVKSNPILAFALAGGHLFNKALGIPVAIGSVFGILLVEGFVITTLDAAVRLNRYLFEELWVVLFKNPPAFMRNFWFNSGLSVVLMLTLGATNAFTKLWPIFGAANQLLAALALLTITVWLLVKGRRFWFALIPALFMICTTLASLIILFQKYHREGNQVLAFTAVLLFALSGGVIALAIKRVVIPMLSGKKIEAMEES